MSPSTSTARAVPSPVEPFRSPPSVTPGEPTDFSYSSSSSSSISNITQSFPFSSGNPRIEETSGIMILYRHHEQDDVAVSTLPVERKPLVCVFGVPDHMTYADFCRFCGSFIQHILEMRIIRTDGAEDRYSVLIRFDSQESTDHFYKHFNRRRFSSLEVEVCHIYFMVDVQYTGSIEHAQAPCSSTEQPSCAVCLERLDQDMGGILTTICNHSFHCSCISKWTDTSCLVCRYSQQQPEKSNCFICQTSENLWMCIICGFVGCGRYKEGHAIKHWKETQHCYSLEVETQRVWDYAGDNYVHRLIQSKTDGKLVELNAQCRNVNDHKGDCECVDSAFSEALLNSRVEAVLHYNILSHYLHIVNEYNELLATQLENRKKYFESLLQEISEETGREISRAVDMAVPVKKMQEKLDICVMEKKFLDDLNDNLLKNQDVWKAKMLEVEEREKKASKLKEDKISNLEEQLMNLMRYLETGTTVESSNETNDDPILQVSQPSNIK